MVGKHFKTKRIVFGLLFSLLFSLNHFSSNDFAHEGKEATSFYKNTVNRRVEGNQSSLWTPVSSIEDGSVYMIRSAENQNLYWDLTGGGLTNGTQVQLYGLNYSYAQKFYFKKQFNIYNSPTYRLIPLYDYDKVLRFDSDSENEILKIADETYSDNHLFSDKICLTQAYDNPTQFHISTCFGDALSGNVSVDSVASGQKIKLKSNNTYYLNQHRWEIIKTDYIGLNVGNKTYINGTNEIRYVVRVPHPGKYVVETRPFGGNSIDTYLRLVRDSDNVQVSQNDDGGIDNNALITYNFSNTEEHSIFARGYSSNVTGYCYVVLRPLKTIYMTGTYDIDNQHIDRVSALNDAKPYCRDLGYFPEVYGNLNHSTVFTDMDWEDKNKIDRDYYLFYGHGGAGGASAFYFNGSSPDQTYYYSLPTFLYADLIIWMICNGANYDPQNSINHCMAYDSVDRGANRSLGFRGEIWNITADKFIPKLFEALKTNNLGDACSIASQYAINSNWLWWVLFGQFNCDIANPVVFTKESKEAFNIHFQAKDTTKTKSNYVIDNGFFKKKDVFSSGCSNIYREVNDTVDKLKKEWDEVLLFLGGNQNNPKPIAMCINCKYHHCRYCDLYTNETIDPDCFDEIMGASCNE